MVYIITFKLTYGFNFSLLNFSRSKLDKVTR